MQVGGTLGPAFLDCLRNVRAQSQSLKQMSLLNLGRQWTCMSDAYLDLPSAPPLQSLALFSCAKTEC